MKSANNSLRKKSTKDSLSQSKDDDFSALDVKSKLSTSKTKKNKVEDEAWEMLNN